MSNTDNLINHSFMVLKCLYDYRGPDGFSRITQQEISEKLHINRVTINKIFKNLSENHLIIVDSKHLSKYLLTEDAIKAVKALKKII